MSMIRIRKSETADTRTCDFAKVSKEQLAQSSRSHIDDVKLGLRYFAEALDRAAIHHDYDKLTDIDGFHADFVGGFKSTTWWDEHRKLNRHHINMPDGVRIDVDLVDVIEHVVDCVMAGKARSGGKVFDVELPDELLQKALKNTVELLKANVEVVNE